MSLWIWVSWVGKKHITMDMCCSGGGTDITRNTTITRDICFPGRKKRIARHMCFPDRGTHITRSMCFRGRGTYITRDMCF